MVKAAKQAVNTAMVNVLIDIPHQGNEQVTLMVPPAGDNDDASIALLLYEAIINEREATRAKESLKKELIAKRGNPTGSFLVQVPVMGVSIEISWKEPSMVFEIDPRLQKSIDDLIMAAKENGNGKMAQKRTGYYAASIKNN